MKNDVKPDKVLVNQVFFTHKNGQMNVRFYGVLLSLFFTSAIVADAIPKVIYHQNGEMMMKDKKMLIVFDEAVVEREQVGTPVSSDFLKTEPALQFEATWETPIPYSSPAPSSRSGTGR